MLDKLLENAKKSRNRKWTDKTVTDYTSLLNDILETDKTPESDVRVVQLREILKEQESLRELQTEEKEEASGGSSEGSGAKEEASGGLAETVVLDVSGSQAEKEESKKQEKAETINEKIVEMANLPVPGFFTGKNWSVWLRNFQMYCEVAAIPEANQKNLFIYLLGAENVMRLEQKIKPEVLSNISFVLLKKDAELLWNEKDPRKAANNFFSLVQSRSEIKDYAYQLRSLAVVADINSETVLTNKFISGLSNKTIKFELLKDEKIITLDEALKKAEYLNSIVNVENSDVNALNRSGASNKKDNKSEKKNKYNSANKQFNKKKNSEDKKDIKCFYCKKPGHMIKNCYKRKNNEKANSVEQQQNPPEQSKQQQPQKQQSVYNQLGMLSLHQ